MILCVAKNWQEFDKWRERNVVYIGDKRQLELINPADVEDIKFIGTNFREHPVYFSDELFAFQVNQSLARNGTDIRVTVGEVKPTPPWYKRWLSFLSADTGFPSGY